jgi:hypothetical protein
MYENYKPCPKLKAKQKCFRVQRYRDGTIVEVFHEHVPASRISVPSELETLRALAGQAEGWNGMLVLHSRLNDRPGDPSRHPRFVCTTSYPEAGVLRRYVTAANSTAWSDSVVVPEQFRQKENAHS